MVIPKPNWYVSCSPRDPRKLVPELRLLLKYDGKKWDVNQQENYAKELQKLESFEGEGYEKELAFSARDRVAKLKTYGFVYVKENLIHITFAGRRICETSIPEEVFLMQMMKWQVPSFQHDGKQYPREHFFIRPFIFTSKLIQALNGISKTELAIFAFTTTKEEEVHKVIEDIKDFRKKREGVFGKVKKKEFDYYYHYERIKIAFKEFITQGKTNLRESGIEKFSEEDFLNTKINSSYDMADALVRHLRFTPLFTAQGKRVVISENMQDIVSKINSLPIKLNEDYYDVEIFNIYMGNPDLPSVIDDKPSLIEEIKKISNAIISRFTEARKYKKDLIVPPTIDLEKEDTHKLKEHLFKLIYLDKNYKRVLLEVSLRTKDNTKEILVTYDEILDNEVIDPSAYFEWNTWRAFLNIDDEESIIPNFPLDKDLKPLSNAGGRKGDIESIYTEMAVLIEVSLSSGERQANTEIEPVWRHVGNFQNKNEGKKTYGLFIAPDVNKASYMDFFVRATHPLFEGKKVVIIPLSLNQFREILLDFAKIGSNKSSALKDLLRRFEEEANSGRHQHGGTWASSFTKIIQEWKKDNIKT